MKRLRMIATLTTPLAFALVTASQSRAVVDMKNANYAEAVIDITLPGTSYDLKIQRYYNSRSVFSGLFGFGWCSDFETVLEKLPEGRLKLTECGAGQEVIYSPSRISEDDLDKTIEAIITYYKKNNSGATAKTVETLRRQLREYNELRADWAKQAGLPGPKIAKGAVYKAENLEIEQITFQGSHYIRHLSDGTSQTFDDRGRLVILSDKNGNYLRVSYVGDNLKEVVDVKGRKLTFHFKGKRIDKITGPKGISAQYKFHGELLSEVKNMWRNTYSYQYDETRNLTRINYPDGTFKALSYNQKNDWVMSFTDRAVKGVACTETYDYQVDKENPRDHFWSTAVKKCGEEIKNEARFEFWHKTRGDGRKYLSRVLTKSMTDSLDVTYHPEFGRPTVVKKDGITTTFDYYSNGLIREKTTTATRMRFSYDNPHNKVSKVVAEFIDNKGKTLRKRETTFEYDKKNGNLRAARNSDGQSVTLTYDPRGRIASITDQAKKEVRIEYDDRTGKPLVITRPQVGALKMTYKPNGELDEVKSPDGPTVAVQIASTFNNLLDIIAPATSELNL